MYGRVLESPSGPTGRHSVLNTHTKGCATPITRKHARAPPHAAATAVRAPPGTVPLDYVPARAAAYQLTWYQQERSAKSSAAVCVAPRAIHTSVRRAKNSTSSRPEQASKGHDLGFGVGHRA